METMSNETTMAEAIGGMAEAFFGLVSDWNDLITKLEQK